MCFGKAGVGYKLCVKVGAEGLDVQTRVYDEFDGGAGGVADDFYSVCCDVIAYVCVVCAGGNLCTGVEFYFEECE